MRAGILLIFLVLAACDADRPAPAPSSTTPTAAHTGALAKETVATRVAALPAPYNAGSFERGRNLYAQCRSCHTIEAGGANTVGPRLYGIIDRPAGTMGDFRGYSEGLKASGVQWTLTTLDRWIADPRDVVAVNNMIYPGIRKAEDRRDLIAYIAVASAE